MARKKSHTLHVGDRVESLATGWTGTVERLLGPTRSAGGALMVRVRWDMTGFSGRIFEARLKRDEVK